MSARRSRLSPVTLTYVRTYVERGPYYTTSSCVCERGRETSSTTNTTAWSPFGRKALSLSLASFLLPFPPKTAEKLAQLSVCLSVCLLLLLLPRHTDRQTDTLLKRTHKKANGGGLKKRRRRRNKMTSVDFT